MNEMHLCLNCLEVGGEPFPVGPDKGLQREPVRDTIDLCEPCASALSEGDITRFALRHASARTVERP